MDWPILLLFALIAAGASFLTFFSGFGLGTILLPVFSLFFPIELAVAAAAFVHLVNNLFKGGLVFRSADRGIVLKFGAISILGALAGAWVLTLLETRSLATYQIGSLDFFPDIPGIVIGSFLLIFSFLELLPASKNMTLRPEYMVPGGFISGFFGGLSGHQGALRTAFLSRAGLSKEAFIGTGVMIACLVDLTRIPVYLYGGSWEALTGNQGLLITMLFSCGGAILGALLGNALLKKTGYPVIRAIVSIFLLVMGILMIMGIRW